MDSVCQSSFRLPGDIIPIHYDLEITPNAETLSFQGKVCISINVLKGTDRIIINNVRLTLSKTEFYKDESSLAPSKIEYREDDCLCEIIFAQNLPVGLAELRTNFDGKVGTDMRGLYLSTYEDNDKVKHKCLVTQFEPNDACRAFPCFDEPCYKATYKLTLVYLPQITALSNTDLLSTVSRPDGMVAYTFDTTPKMSSYLVAFVLGKFGCLSKVTQSGVKISVYTPIHKTENGTHALEAGSGFIEFYNKYFKIPYPLPKIDLIAIADNAFGAMENWGLVTFREDLLLISSSHSSTHTLESVNLVIAHEFAHQWFGNLVTMKWWTDLWLNEGFANWIEYLSVDTVYPNLKVWQSFMISNYCQAMELDSFETSHPIEIDVKRPTEIDEIFDAITYSKGASIINMMYHYMGNDSFAEGLFRYFNKFKYQNVTTEDLWEALSSQTGKPISKIMRSYTKQTGYPVVEVSHSLKNMELTLEHKQSRFKLDGNGGSDEGQLWVIPLSVFCDGTPDASKDFFLLEEAQSRWVLKLTSNPAYILLNPNRHAFYRVCYSAEMLSMILSNIQKLSFDERLGLLTDYFSFARSGRVSTSKYLDIVMCFHASNERNEEVWRYIVSSLDSILALLHHSKKSSEDIERFKKFCNSICKPVLDSYGLSHDCKDIKSKGIIKLICALLSLLWSTDENGVGETLRSWINGYVDGSLAVLPDFRTQMFRAGFAKPSMFDKLINHFKAATETEEKVDLIMGMSGVRDPALVERLCAFSLDECVKIQDGRFIFTALGRNPISCPISWNYLKANFSEIKKRYAHRSLLSRIYKDSILGLYDMQKHDEAQEFFKNNMGPEIDRCLLQGLESIRIKHSWLVRDQQEISEWLSRNVAA